MSFKEALWQLFSEDLGVVLLLCVRQVPSANTNTNTGALNSHISYSLSLKTKQSTLSKEVFKTEHRSTCISLTENIEECLLKKRFGHC